MPEMRRLASISRRTSSIILSWPGGACATAARRTRRHVRLCSAVRAGRVTLCARWGAGVGEELVVRRW
jgi:hypothetical protein